VAIGRIWLDWREVGLDGPMFGAGWHAPEPSGRWTDGDALLDVAGARALRFTLAMTGGYWRGGPPEPRSDRVAKSPAVRERQAFPP
jgi:hypothetical protein